MNKAKDQIRLSPRTARKLINEALIGAGTSPANAARPCRQEAITGTSPAASAAPSKRPRMSILRR